MSWLKTPDDSWLDYLLFMHTLMMQIIHLFLDFFNTCEIMLKYPLSVLCKWSTPWTWSWMLCCTLIARLSPLKRDVYLIWELSVNWCMHWILGGLRQSYAKTWKLFPKLIFWQQTLGNYLVCPKFTQNIVEIFILWFWRKLRPEIHIAGKLLINFTHLHVWT